MHSSILSAVAIISLYMLTCAASAEECVGSTSSCDKRMGQNGRDWVTLIRGQEAIATHFARQMQVGENRSLRYIKFHRIEGNEGRVLVDMFDSTAGIDIKQQGNEIIVVFLNTHVPNYLVRNLDVADFVTPVDSIKVFERDGNSILAVDTHGNVEWGAYQVDNKFALIVTSKYDKSGSSAQRVTENFQNTPLNDVLKTMAVKAQRKPFVSDSIGGIHVIRFQNVQWETAFFDALLENMGLQSCANGDVIMVAPRPGIDGKNMFQGCLSGGSLTSDNEPLWTDSFQLAYIKGEEVVAKLLNKEHRILSQRGSAVVDQRTNTLFVQDAPSRVEEVRKLVKQYDVPVK
jgi:type IV pilus assembly protein PilQ